VFDKGGHESCQRKHQTDQVSALHYSNITAKIKLHSSCL